MVAYTPAATAFGNTLPTYVVPSTRKVQCSCALRTVNLDASRISATDVSVLGTFKSKMAEIGDLAVHGETDLGDTFLRGRLSVSGTFSVTGSIQENGSSLQPLRPLLTTTPLTAALTAAALQQSNAVTLDAGNYLVQVTATVVNEDVSTDAVLGPVSLGFVTAPTATSRTSYQGDATVSKASSATQSTSETWVETFILTVGASSSLRGTFSAKTLTGTAKCTLSVVAWRISG
jgi:hypothetical protein